MSDDDNYSWLDKYTSDNPEAPMPPVPSHAPHSSSSSAAQAPPVSGTYVDRDNDPLAEQLLATQPKRLRPPKRTKNLPLKIGLVILGLGALIYIANFTSLADSRRVTSLDPGECFEAPDSLSRVRQVRVQDCALPHGGEVYAEANGLSSEAEEKCVNAFSALDPERIAALPADTQFAVLGTTILHRCVVISPSGQLTGSLTQ